MATEFVRQRCDGLFIPAVDNLGVRLPVEEFVREIRRRVHLRFVVVDGAQAFCHVPTSLASGCCDLYIAGCHKWLRAYFPLGLAFYGRKQSQADIEASVGRFIRSGVVDDPLLVFSEQLEKASTGQFGETVNLIPIFSCLGAVSDILSAADSIEHRFTRRLENAQVIAELSQSVDWTVLQPHQGLRSGIVLLQATDARVRRMKPDALRSHFIRHGVAVTTYRHGLVRLSMPTRTWQENELARLMEALRTERITSPVNAYSISRSSPKRACTSAQEGNGP